jgi:hypothetical protein
MVYLGMTFVTALQKSLTTRIAPMVYVLMAINILIGIFFATGIVVGGTESVLYNTGVLVNRAAWGAMLLTTSGIGMYGLIKGQEWAMSLSGIAGAMLWLFAAISVALAAHWYIFITITTLHFLFHVYVYLGTTTGTIFRTTV